MAKLNTNKEIECLERLAKLNESLNDIVEFLAFERLLLPEEVKDYRQSPFKAKLVQQLLQRLKDAGQLQLLEYEWHILPIERIKIIILTNRDSKEFTYNF